MRKVQEMEARLFQDGFIPDRLHEARHQIPSVDMDHSYTSPAASGNEVHETRVQLNSEITETNTQDIGAHPSGLEHSEDSAGLKSQSFYGLLDLEKTLLQAASTLACDGGAMLDAMVYFLIIPMSGMFMIR